jgi:uncharacterized membrane protein
MGVKLNIILLILVFAQITPAFAETTPQNVVITVYSDGTTRLDYLFQADITSLQTNVSLLGESYGDLLIINEEGLPLEYVEAGDGLTVYSLGSSLVNLTYVTAELTGKAGAIWSLRVNTSISTEVVLPQGATVVNLNTIPLEIDIQDGKTDLIMPPGPIEVQYTVDIIDSETLAQTAISNAEDAIQEAINNGIVVTEAQTQLAEAKTLFQQGNNLDAEEKATGVLQLVETTVDNATTANAKITAAGAAIQAAHESGRTKGLDEAEKLLADAQSKYQTGDYEQALNLAGQAFDAALNTEKPGNYTGYIAVGVIIVVASAAYYLYKRKPPQEYTREEVDIDLDRLFEEHPELRMDDREVLKYIAENEGEAFAYDIRERFDIPRTSAWRMIQRLQRFEVVNERKIGGQSLISIKEEYRRKQ